jgi:regulator of protease activity HflC (stomatin/prohibitin superfamily)
MFGASTIGLLLALFFLILLIASAIKILPEYERGVVFRLGRLRPVDYGPGLFLLIPIVDRMTRISFRRRTSSRATTSPSRSTRWSTSGS